MDLINRQAAIDELSLDKEMINRVLDDMNVVGTDREKYSWGLGLIESNIKDIEELPSAQPEIIRCKVCKWFGKAGCAILIVDDSDKPTEDDYCSFAERRKDGRSD